MLPRILDRIAHALGARLVTYLDWNGEALDRPRDAEHASLVDHLVRLLRSLAWEVEPEATFAIAGERGSVDVLAWHTASRALLVVEVKSVLADAQETLARLDRKVRLAARIGPPAWHPAAVSSLLVIGDTRTNRRRVASLASTFDAAYPDRIAVIRAFLKEPGGRSVRGLWFLTSSTPATARHRVRRS